MPLGRLELFVLRLDADEVCLVSDHYDLDVGLRMSIYLLQPVVDVEKTLLVEQVEAEDDAVSALIIGVRDCAVALLPGGVPDLQLDLLAAVAE